MKKETRGGKRKGAGRPARSKLATAVLYIRVPKKQLESLRALVIKNIKC